MEQLNSAYQESDPMKAYRVSWGSTGGSGLPPPGDNRSDLEEGKRVCQAEVTAWLGRPLEHFIGQDDSSSLQEICAIHRARWWA